MSASVPTTSRVRVWGALATVYVVWGSTYLAMKWAVADLPALPTGALRFFGAGLVFFLLGWARAGALRVSRRELRNAALVGIAMPGLCNGLVFLAQRTVSSSLTAVLLAIMPLWVALIEALRPSGERPSRPAIVGLVIGFLGTALLVTGRGGLLATDLSGLVLLVISAVVWAAFSIFAKHAARPSAWMVSAGLEMMAGGLLQAALALMRGDWSQLAVSEPGLRAILSVVYLVVAGSWIGYGSFSWLVRHASPALASTYAYVNPLVAVALGALLAGESLTARTLLAAGLIVAAVVLVTSTSARRRA
jgi:drug/metabolite transporter (DMT)-like permease